MDGWRDPFATTDPVTYHAAFLPPDERVGYLSDHVALTATVERSFG